MKNKEFIPLGLIILLFAVSLYIYPSMPGVMPTHWNAKGEIDDYSSRFIGVFLIPLITLGIYLVFSLIPKIAVFKKNISDFKPYLYWIKIAMVVFLGFVYFATLLPNFGFEIKMNKLIIPGIAFLFLIIGFTVGKIKRNYFIGFRTPWTLSSDNVWRKTHKAGSRLFVALGILILVVSFFSDSIWFLLIGALFITGWSFVYSYILFRQETKKK